jgi:hypothetical protein
MKTSVHLWQYLAEFFLEWEILKMKFVEKIEKHFLYSIFFSEILAFCEMEKYGRVGHVTNDNIMWLFPVECLITRLRTPSQNR